MWGLGPSVLSPSLKVEDFSLGSGKVHSTVFVGLIDFSFFTRCGHSDSFLELFLSDKALVIRRLSFP